MAEVLPAAEVPAEAGNFMSALSEFFIWFFMFLAAVLLIWLFSFFYRKKLNVEKAEYAGRNLKKQKNEKGEVDFVRCPVCSTPMACGENMTSRIFHPMNTPHQKMIVLGCPHCYPEAEKGVRRLCPVCRKELPLKGYLVARLFNRENNKKHVIITGCTECLPHEKHFSS